MSASDFVSRGQALVAAGQFQEAVKVCRLGLLGRPTAVEGRIVLGQALLALKRYDEVLAEMRVALELDHASVPAQTLKAEALLRKGDSHAAIEALHRARQAAPGDPRILQLLGEAEHGAGRAPANLPGVGYVGAGDTKHYPQRQPSDADDPGPDSYTKPTSVAKPAPAAKPASFAAPASAAKAQAKRRDATPSPAELEVGDKSGTVEVDPDLDGVELGSDDDFDDVAAPPAAYGGARGSANSARSGATVEGKRKMAARPVSTPAIEVDDDDFLESAETRLPVAKIIEPRRKAPGPGTAVRNAVQLPSGPLDGRDLGPAGEGRRGALDSVRREPGAKAALAGPRAKQPSVQPLAALPQSTQVQGHGRQDGPVASAMPTMHGAAPPPAQPFAPPPASLAASRPTIALQAPPPLAAPPPAVANTLFAGGQGAAPNWARATIAVSPDPRSVAAANETTAKPGQQLDPALAALMAGSPADSGLAVVVDPAQPAKDLKTGMRRTRSRMQVVMWIVIGVVVIGGGVFAGFQIRAMRLQKQIAAARDHATDLAKADTWSGWTAARDSLAGIVQASNTSDNRAVLARARSLIAFEFGDGLTEARAAVEALGGQGALDGSVAAAYLALADNDPKAARLAADAAATAGPQDAGALYVVGQAALLGGDAKAAVGSLKAAAEREPRPLFTVGLARALAATYAWEDAVAVLDKLLATSADHPGAAIARASVLAASGRIAPASPLGTEVHAQLDRIIAEGARPIREQQHGVSPAQIASADLALARVDYARGDVNAARADVIAAANVGLDDQRFAEDAIETLFALGDLPKAAAYADKAIATWPTSRPARIARAEILLASGKAQDALDLLSKQTDVTATPRGQAVRGQARFAAGDLDGARADFDAALQKLPNLEPAIVGRAWLDLAAGNVDAAKQRIEPRYSDKGSTPAITTIYAAILRLSGDPAARDKAKAMLEKVVAGPPGLEVARAQLELARIYRDLGDYRNARPAYAEASRTGNFEARLEIGLLQIDDRDPIGGRDTLDQLLKEAGDHPSASLVLEVARARMLAGDHVGATQLLDLADKLPGVVKWKLERERGRLAVRKGDFAAAAAALGHALEACGDDAETFLLAAETVTSEDKQAAALADKVKKLAAERLKGRPELAIVNGKLLIGAGNDKDALATFVSAKEALEKEHASARRLAQARFGIAVAKYNLKNDAEAEPELGVVRELDPSIYAADLYMADLLKDKQKKKAFEVAQHAVAINPDLVQGWWIVGKLAHAVGDKRVLADAIGKLTTLAPKSDELKELQGLRR